MSSPVIRYSAHALDRMELRGITREDVERLFKVGTVSPDPTSTSRNPKLLLEGPISRRHREARIVFKRTKQGYFIITAMFIDPR